MRTLSIGTVFVVSAAALSVVVTAQSGQGRPTSFTGKAMAAVKHDTSPRLRDIPADLREDPDGDREAHAPLLVPKGRGGRPAAPQVDGALQDAPLVPLLAAPTVNFDGVNNLSGVLPPDTNGDVGPNHYVQWVNLKYAVYSKTGVTLVAPTNGNTVFSGFGGPCQTTNNGDPIVLYDEQADRWLLSQFALPNYPSGPFYQCIAISTTGDPSGSYYRYQFVVSNTKMNDYPKFGVWHDGYYMTVNQFVGNTYAGAGIVAFERAAMLAGGAAKMVYVDTNDQNLGGMLPADIDGTNLPAPGTPNYVFQFDDDYPVPGDFLEVWQFATNWTTGTAAFTLKQTLPVAAFDSNMCGYSRSCIAQAGTSVKLDAISDRLMYRLQYRRFADGHESFVTNHTVDANGADRAGVRWYEVRRDPAAAPGNQFSVYQQGTWSPDATNRWMASAAMDKVGNIALAYNTSSSTQYPSIRYAGRLATDPLGTMGQGENDILVGSGAQTHSSSRWGDYSNLSADPTDGCTFWATLEYTSQGSAPWRTRVAAFTLPNCLTTVAPPNGTMGTLSIASPAAYNHLDLSWSYNASDEAGFAIERCETASCTYTEITRTTGTATTYSDTTVAASTGYTYRVRAYNSGGTSGYSNTAAATTAAQPPPTKPTAPATLTATASKRAINLAWTDSSNDETSFKVLRCTGASCVPGALITTTAANVTSYRNSGLTSNTTYSYIVQACNAGGCSNSPTATAKAK